MGELRAKKWQLLSPVFIYLFIYLIDLIDLIEVECLKKLF